MALHAHRRWLKETILGARPLLYKKAFLNTRPIDYSRVSHDSNVPDSRLEAAARA
jgi:hypothetical protein